MAYIRVKKFKRKSGKVLEYAYIVENRWKKRVGKGSKKGPRQKVKGYLGRVFKLDKKGDIDFFSHFSIDGVEDYIGNNDKRTIIMDLVRFELIRHGFEEAGKLLSNGNIFFDLDNNEFSSVKGKVNKKIVLELNEGFMCKETVEKLINFKVREEEDGGFRLAKTFVEAGLKVPEEIFVGFFEKLNR